MGKYRKPQQKPGWGFRLGVILLKPLLIPLVKRRWIDPEKIPATGGGVLVANHISHIDPITLAWLLWDWGRIPRYLTKDALWKVPFVGAVVRSAKQIPVSRLSTDAAKSYEAACQAVDDGELVAVYPEGTITKDPNGWPMRGKTGAARIALTTGKPVIPVGQWGAQEVLPAYTAKFRPGKTVSYKVGDPVDLSEFADQPITADLLHAATERIMDAITALVAELREEAPPQERFDPKAAGVNEIGNPKNKPKEAS